MSDSKSSAHVHLRSAVGPIRIRLLDHQFRQIESSFGELKLKVDPGIYLVQTSAGGKEEEQFISVKPGQGYEDFELSAPLHSAVPFSSSGGADAEQAEALDRLCHSAGRHSASRGKLVIFVRQPGGNLSAQFSMRGMGLRDAEGKCLTQLGDETEGSLSQGWKARVEHLKPGGYLLTWPSKRHNRWSKDTELKAAVMQPIWVVAGTTTVVTMLAHPKRLGPRMTGMSILMVRCGKQLGLAPSHESEVTKVQEISLAGLRQGRALVPENLVKLLEDSDFANPMAGIVGAHALLLRSSPPWAQFDRLITHLDRILPNSPDAVALRMLGKQRRESEVRTRTRPISFPPMIYQGYRGLLSRDWQEGGVVYPGSLAERAASMLLPYGPWTVWKTEASPVSKSPPSASLSADFSTNSAGLSSAIEELNLQMETSTKQWWQDAVETEDVENMEAAVQRIHRVIDQYGEGPGTVSPKGMFAQLQQMGLPMATVKRVLDEDSG